MSSNDSNIPQAELFEVGDVVTLRSGGPRLTVAQVDSLDSRIAVVWAGINGVHVSLNLASAMFVREPVVAPLSSAEQTFAAQHLQQCCEQALATNQYLHMSPDDVRVLAELLKRVCS